MQIESIFPLACFKTTADCVLSAEFYGKFVELAGLLICEAACMRRQSCSKWNVLGDAGYRKMGTTGCRDWCLVQWLMRDN